MRLTFILFLTIFFSISSIAQTQITEIEFKSILVETLKKSRNIVPNAQNNWRYDNTKDDYFNNDTIILNSARTYRSDYCKEVRWSFYENEKFVLENTLEFTEPPTMLKPQKEDYIDLEYFEKNNKLYLILKYDNRTLDKFEVLELRRNTPIKEEESAFDYTLILKRIKNQFGIPNFNSSFTSAGSLPLNSVSSKIAFVAISCVVFKF